MSTVSKKVQQLALNALQAGLVGFQLHRRLAQRAYEDLEQIFADGHGSLQCNKVTENLAE